ncbi:Uncharacterized protein Rs2_28650 [Raphanus sativus]|nr:Uncharacterized protein Rs2_28650 [Raphanus sativus]
MNSSSNSGDLMSKKPDGNNGASLAVPIKQTGRTGDSSAEAVSGFFGNAGASSAVIIKQSGRAGDSSAKTVSGFPLLTKANGKAVVCSDVPIRQPISKRKRREHWLIVCELLKDILYEFNKFNRESGGDVYYTMPILQNILVKSYSRCELVAAVSRQITYSPVQSSLCELSIGVSFGEVMLCDGDTWQEKLTRGLFKWLLRVGSEQSH